MQGLHARENKERPQAAVGPPLEEHQWYTSSHDGKPAEGTGRTKIILMAAGQQRPPVFRFRFQDRKIQA